MYKYAFLPQYTVLLHNLYIYIYIPICDKIKGVPVIGPGALLLLAPLLSLLLQALLLLLKPLPLLLRLALAPLLS